MGRYVGVALVACVLSGPLWAGVVPRGAEFRVNSYTTGSQLAPTVASDTDGDFVMVWSSWNQDGFGWGVFGRRFDSAGAPLGSEFQVNTYTTFYQDNASVASDAAGNFVVVWATWYQDGEVSGIAGRLFDSTGLPTGPEFQVNSYWTSYQESPSLASNATGNFVAIWPSLGQDGSGWGGFGQAFDDTGTPLGPEFQINTYTTSTQAPGSVALDDAGNFVVVWSSLGQDGSEWGVFGRRFDSTGAPLGSEFQVNTWTTSYQQSPSVASDASGNFVVVWQSWEQDGSYWGVFGRRFDSTGVPAGPELPINTFTAHHQTSPSVVSDAEGGFVVAWTSYGQDGSGYGVFARRFDSTGAAAGPEVQVNTHTTDDQSEPSVAADAYGRFVVAWRGFGQDGSDWGVFGRRYFGRSPALTSHLAGDMVDCSDPRVIRPTLTWEGDGYDRFRVFIGWEPGFGKGLRVTSGDTLLRATSWTPPAKKWRKACANALAVNPGSPKLYVKVLGQDSSLTKKNPVRRMESATVQVDVQL